MNKMPHINADDRAVLAALKSAHDSGKQGLYRAEIYEHQECEAVEDIQQISTALSKLRAAGLVLKGPRNGPAGSLWTWVADWELEMDCKPSRVPDLSQKITSQTELAEYDEDGDLVTVTCAAQEDPADPADDAIDREIDALADRLRTPPHRIEQIQLKQRVLRRLAEITEGSISAVLNDIADDIGKPFC